MHIVSSSSAVVLGYAESVPRLELAATDNIPLFLWNLTAPVDLRLRRGSAGCARCVAISRRNQGVTEPAVLFKMSLGMWTITMLSIDESASERLGCLVKSTCQRSIINDKIGNELACNKLVHSVDVGKLAR